MGWWQSTPDGGQTRGATGPIWGDEPADILDAALDKIRGAYRRDWDRDPTHAELEAGLKFCLGGL